MSKFFFSRQAAQFSVTKEKLTRLYVNQTRKFATVITIKTTWTWLVACKLYPSCST